MLELARLEYERSQRAPPALSGRLLERFPSLLPDLAAERPRPDCSSEFVESMTAATFASETVEYSALLLARIRAVGNVLDSSHVTPAKASFLLRLAQIPDAELGQYRITQGEEGVVPPKALVRQLATGELAASSLFFDDLRVRSFLATRVRTSRDPRELLLVHAAAARAFGDEPLGNKRGDPNPRLLESWLDELPAQVARRAGPEELELVLLRLRLIGLYAQPFFAGDRARDTVRELLGRSSDLAISSPHAGIARDLRLALRAALFDLERPIDYEQEPLGGLPRRERPAFAQNWLLPTRLRLKRELSRQRLSELEQDLRRFEYSDSRCAIVLDMPRYADKDNAGAVFDLLLGSATTTRKRPVAETACRIAAALELPDLAERKAALLARLIEPARLARDRDGLIESLVAERLIERPELVWQRPELVNWVLARAELAAPLSSRALQTLAELLLSNPRLEPLPGWRVKMLRAWISELARLPASGRLRKPPGRGGLDPYGETVLHQRLFAIGQFAKASGLEGEARTLATELLKRFGEAPEDHTKVGLARAATLTLTLLDLR